MTASCGHRDCALFDVMLINVFNFGATSIIWAAKHDVAAHSVMRFFFAIKSLRLFPFLFGFGFALQFLRADQLQTEFTRTHIWRLVLLFCFGMANALLYDSDILIWYAEMGLLLVLFWKMPPRALLLLAAGYLFIQRCIVFDDTASSHCLLRVNNWFRTRARPSR